MKSTFLLFVALAVTVCISFGSVTVVAYDLETTIDPIVVNFPKSLCVSDYITNVHLWVDGDNYQPRRDDTGLLSFDVVAYDDNIDVTEVFVFDIKTDPNSDVLVDVVDTVYFDVDEQIPEPNTFFLLLATPIIVWRRRRS